MSKAPAKPHEILTRVVASLGEVNVTSTKEPSSSGCTLTRLSSEDTKATKAAMMTLHFLFPHELLPALDLLDRRLLTRLLVLQPGTTEPLGRTQVTDTTSSVEGMQNSSETFYVQSASAITNKKAKPGRFRKTYDPSTMFYEVHLDSWNCSCPAFAYSAFQEINETAGSVDFEVKPEVGKIPDSRVWTFGGSLTSDAIGTPICKHILAATIGKAAPALFPHSTLTKLVRTTELAGWAAGWGE